jgi:hypothetical protein
LFFCTTIAIRHFENESIGKGPVKANYDQFLKAMNRGILFVLNHSIVRREYIPVVLGKINHNIKLILCSQNIDVEFLRSFSYFMHLYIEDSDPIINELSKKVGYLKIRFGQIFF